MSEGVCRYLYRKWRRYSNCGTQQMRSWATEVSQRVPASRTLTRKSGSYLLTSVYLLILHKCNDWFKGLSHTIMFYSTYLVPERSHFIDTFPFLNSGNLPISTARALSPLLQKAYVSVYFSTHLFVGLFLYARRSQFFRVVPWSVEEVTIVSCRS